jgi:phosphatidylserine/phosphatidylglycerophosphate/cardiolipin synthase-like enzyme
MRNLATSSILGAVAYIIAGPLFAGGFNGRQLALVGQGILRDRKLHTPEGKGVELVATGPAVAGLVHRETSVVIHDLFAQAEKSVLVAGYAVFQGQKIFQPLAERMISRPGLQVRLFFDIARSHRDTSASSELIRQFIDRFRRDDWPAEAPVPQLFFDSRSLDSPGGVKASLHAKCVVVDTRTTFISSANFTEAALERNIELGLLASNPDLALQVTSFFDRLIEQELLVRVL